MKKPNMLLSLTEAEACSLYMHLATNCPSKELGAVHRKLERMLTARRQPNDDADRGHD